MRFNFDALFLFIFLLMFIFMFSFLHSFLYLFLHWLWVSIWANHYAVRRGEIQCYFYSKKSKCIHTNDEKTNDRYINRTVNNISNSRKEQLDIDSLRKHVAYINKTAFSLVHQLTLCNNRINYSWNNIKIDRIAHQDVCVLRFVREKQIFIWLIVRRWFCLLPHYLN